MRVLSRPVRGRPHASLSRAILLATSSLLVMAGSARSADECGPLVSGNATCTPSGNPYPAGINYSAGGAGDVPVSLSILSGVNIAIPAGAGGASGVNAANSTGVTSASANITITGDGVTINNTANSVYSDSTGFRIQSSGDAVVTATNTTIGVSGTASEDGIVAFAMPNLTGAAHVASITWSGASITSSGTESTGIQADNRGIGNATIMASGNITGTPGVGQSGFYGLIAHAGDSLFVSPGSGDASVTYSSGTINAYGNRPRGIVAWVEGDGSASVTTGAGTAITITGSDNPGVDPPTLPLSAAVSLQLDSAMASNHRSITANVASRITIFGAATPGAFFRNPTGIRALAYADAPIMVTYTGPGITTRGGGAAAIMALSAAGSIDVKSSGPIDTASGLNAIGILADSGTKLSRSSGDFADTQAIHAPVPAITTTGLVHVTVTSSVSTGGEFGTGIGATAGSGGVTVDVASGGSAMGGWQADPASVGPVYGTPAVGVIFGSGGLSVLNNAGTIGALSDRAVATSDIYPGSDPQINNAGVITGYVRLGAGDNSVTNSGVFNLRDFEQTTASGGRDTLRVAVADLGSGANNSFVNSGTLALLGGPGAATIDAGGQYLPYGNRNNAMALNGPAQGQILGAASFGNAGTIDLTANSVAGDVLVITGGHVPGTSGGGTFVSDGGTLKLNTVLNTGGADSQSDMLVVDGTSVGAHGPTGINVTPAGGAGGLTTGNGIAVVQVLDPSRSAAGAFVLSNRVESGPYEYLLYQGGPVTGASGDWFLRDTAPPPTTPTTPPSNPTTTPTNPITPPSNPTTPPTIPPTPPSNPTTPPSNPTTPPSTPISPLPVPIFRPGAALYAIASPVARQSALITLGTFHERRGDQWLVVSRDQPETGTATVFDGSMPFAPWGRIFGEGVKHEGGGQLQPEFEGQDLGVQLGLDLARFQIAPDGTDHVGVFYAYSHVAATGRGFIVDVPFSLAGHASLSANNVGAYWTHIGQSGWYADAVVMESFNEYAPNARLDVTAELNGSGTIGSLEAGYPFRLTDRMELETQGQLILQTTVFGNAFDPYTTLSFDSDLAFTARAGLQLQDNLDWDSHWVQPRLFVNFWHTAGGKDTTLYNAVIPLPIGFQQTLIEVGTGAAARVSGSVGLFGQFSYSTNIGGDYIRRLNAMIGLRVTP